MQILISSFRCIFVKAPRKIIPTNTGELKPVPNYIIWLIVYLCISVLLQGIGDVALKVCSLMGLLPAMPWRTDFLFLTAISVLMGYRTLGGMLHEKFDVTRNSIELGILVEVALVVGDSLFIRSHIHEIPNVALLRIPFVGLTLVNIAILLYAYHELQCRNWVKKTRKFSDKIFRKRSTV